MRRFKVEAAVTHIVCDAASAVPGPFSAVRAEKRDWFDAHQNEFIRPVAIAALPDTGRQHDRLIALCRTLSRINDVVISAFDASSFIARLREVIAASNLFPLVCISIIQPMCGDRTEIVCGCDYPYGRSPFEALIGQVLADHREATSRDGLVIREFACCDFIPVWRDEALALGFHACASVPITSSGALYGTISAFVDGNDHFDADLVDLLRQIAGGTAFVLRNLEKASERQSYAHNLSDTKRQLQELSGHLLSIREHERSLMARELHDELGQTLNMLKLDLHALGKVQSSTSPANAIRMIRMTEAIDHALEEVHRVVSNLYPRILDDLGLEPAIEWLVANFIKQSGVACQFDVELSARKIPRMTAKAAFRCVQECLDNVRHQQSATVVRVSLGFDDQLLVLTIAEDGCGSTPFKTAEGIIADTGMRQRVKLLGGSLKANRRRHGGTFVRIDFPME